MSEWKIPSEEMPPEGIEVLVTVTDGVRDAVQIACRIGGDWLSILSNQTVTAWMPMPDPYRSVTYRLVVWIYGRKADDYTTNSLDDLRSYYRDKWRWEEADCNCFCELYVNGEWMNIENTDQILEGESYLLVRSK